MLERLCEVILFITIFDPRKLGNSEVTSVYLSKLTCLKNFFLLLANNFQLDQSDVEKKHAMRMWSYFLAVVLTE